MAATKLPLTEAHPLAVRAAVVAAATAIVHVAVVYGLLDNEAENAIGAVIDAIGLLIVVLWARPAVTPNAKVISRVTTSGDVVAGEAAVAPTGSRLAVERDPIMGDSPTVLPMLVRSELVSLRTDLP